jgi:hypothetical protein
MRLRVRRPLQGQGDVGQRNPETGPEPWRSPGLWATFPCPLFPCHAAADWTPWGGPA